VATLIAFYLFPVSYSAWLSLRSWNPLAPEASRFVGLSNYSRALSEPLFWKAVANTLYFAAGTIPFTVGISLLLAVLLSGRAGAKGFFRAGFFMPYVVSLVVVALVFKNLYAPYGPINSLLGLLGLPQVPWLQHRRLALPAIMAMDVWASVGYYTVILLAGLQTIPRELYEAASVDGAGSWRKFTRITLPMLRPVLLFVIVVNTIKSLQVFIEIFVMTRGGPLNSTLTAVYYIYDEAFHKLRMGYASAVAYVLFALIFLIAVVQMKRLRAGVSAGG